MATKSENRFIKLEKNIDDLQDIKAQCRRKEQEKDHDIILIQKERIDTLYKSLDEHKNDNKEDKKEFKELNSDLTKKLETVSGNINQGMMYIKDMQRNAHIKIGFRTAIVTGIISTVIASIIIYFATTVFETYKTDKIKQQEQQILTVIAERLGENAKEMKRLQSSISEK